MHIINAASGYPRWKYFFNCFFLSTDLAALFETWLKLSCWPHWWKKCAIEGHSISHELQNMLGSLSEWSHRPRKKYNSFPLKNMKIVISSPFSFTTHAYFWCFNLQQLYFICSNYFKFAANFALFAARFFNFQQLYLICSDLFNLQDVSCGSP